MPKKRTKRRTSRPVRGTEVERALVENFISLQRVMANLSSKFDGLANQITKLLELFEISAKALAEKNFKMTGEMGNEKITQKLDALLDQNKIIARGLTLMHEVNTRGNMPMPNPPAKPIPAGVEGYQKSIASDDANLGFESPLPYREKKLKKLPG